MQGIDRKYVIKSINIKDYERDKAEQSAWNAYADDTDTARTHKRYSMRQLVAMLASIKAGA